MKKLKVRICTIGWSREIGFHLLVETTDSKSHEFPLTLKQICELRRFIDMMVVCPEKEEIIPHASPVLVERPEKKTWEELYGKDTEKVTTK